MLVHRSLKQRILSIFFAGACAGANVAMAQDSPVLEEVVVVAQKREQSLQEVPMAVSAFTGDSLRDAGVNTVEALSRQAPSLQVQASNNASAVNYRIRRVGNIGSIPTFEPAVGVFIDGAYRSRPLFTAGELFDIERVEVLRGPQSTLYGKNTTAGVVAIYTRAPAAEFEGNAQLDVGQLDGASWTPFYRVVGGVSGPLSDTVSASIGGNLVGQDHTYEGALASSRPEANDLHRQALRGQLQWTPSDALSVRLIAGYMQEDDNTTQGDVHFVAGSPAAISRNILVATGNAQPCASNDSLDQLHCSLTAPETDLKASEVTLLVDYALNNGMTLTSISSWDWFRNEWAQFDAAQLGSPLLRHQDTQEATSWQEELRLSSTGGETVDWLAGMFFYQNNFDRGDHGKTYTFLEDTLSAAPVPSMLLQQRYGTPFPVPFAAPGQNGYYAASQDTDYFGIFGQATWNISDKFAITGGVRWQNEDKKASLAQGVTVPGFSLMSVALL
ncbi:MAG: TonB-dependent receptor, partial [Lysobacterales bacterium]